MRIATLVSLVLACARVASADAPTADAENIDSDGWTALQRAAQSGDLPAIKALLAKGAKIDAGSPKVYAGATALQIALDYGHPEAAQLLLDRGASIAEPIGSDALALAARDGDIALLDMLIARKVPVKGGRALAAAAKYGHADAIKKLIKAGAQVNTADVDDHAFTPLMVAAQEDKLEAARALIDAGARVNDHDTEGMTALHWAVFGARPTEIHLYRDLSLPHDTVWRPKADAPVVKLLIARGAKLAAVDAAGNTALHEAAMLDARPAAVALVAAGAMKTVKNREGKTALELAKDRENSVVEVLAPAAGPPRKRRK